VPGLVTVIIPFFNRERFLAQTLQSVLGQGVPKLQIILADDGSTGRCCSLAQSLRDRRILLVRSRKRRGKPHAVNQGMRFALGEWVTFFDSDDLMLPGSLQSRMDFLKRRPEALAVMGRVGWLINESGRPLSRSHPVHAEFQSSLKASRRLARRFGSLVPEIFVYGRCPLSPLSVTLFRRDAVRQVGRLDERLAPWEDRDYLMRLALLQPVPFLDLPVMCYRVHRGNASFQVVNGRQFHPKAGLLEKRLKAKYTELSG